MAMTCINLARECDGCGACFKEPETIGRCAACGQSVLADDDRYDIDGEIIHLDCLSDWARKYRVEV